MATERGSWVASDEDGAATVGSSYGAIRSETMYLDDLENLKIRQRLSRTGLSSLCERAHANLTKDQ